MGAVLLSCASLTPSLLPRSPVYQGVVAAAAGLLGYGLGALLGWIVRSCGGRLRGHARRRAWLVVGIAALAGTVAMLTAYLRWENRLRDLVGLTRIGVGSLLRMLLVGVFAFVVLLAVARGLKAAGRLLGRFIGRFLPARVATVTGGPVVALVACELVTGVASNRLLESLDATFMTVNDEFSTDVPAPSSRFVSGGPQPGVTWEDLGRQGRVFIANPPTRGQIGSFSGPGAKAPIRAYVGVGTDATVDLRQEAAQAVAELERLGAFDRLVLNVVTPTGSGWVNENQAQPLEYLWRGDTAT